MNLPAIPSLSCGRNLGAVAPSCGGALFYSDPAATPNRGGDGAGPAPGRQRYPSPALPPALFNPWSL